MEIYTLSEWNNKKKKKNQNGNESDGLKVYSYDEWAEKKGIQPITSTKNREKVDIAPITTTGGGKRREDIAPTKKRTWFEKGAFEDGYQFGDVTKTILGSVKDAEENFTSGILGIGEKVVDAFAYLAPAANQMQQAQNNPMYRYDFNQFNEDKQAAKEFIEKDLYDEMELAKKLHITNLGNIADMAGIDSEKESVFGEKSDSVIQSGGQLAATAILSPVVPWYATSGVTSFGSELESAFNDGADYEAAGGSSLISAGAEILSERLGGISFGGKTLTDTMLKPLTGKISSKVLKHLANFGVEGTAEGMEEVFSSVVSRLGTKLYKDESVEEILGSEEALDEYLESFIGGMVLGGGSSVVGSVAGGKRAEFTENEQKVIDKVVEKRIAEQEVDGVKLSKKEKSAIEEAVKKDLEKGYIDIEDIESAIGGETYDSYKYETEYEENLQKEYDELNKMKTGEMTGVQTDRRAELKQRLEEVKNNSKATQIKTELSQKVSEMAKTDRLIESYNEKQRETQKFDAADIEYKTEAAKKTIDNIVNSGLVNNQNRSKDFVNLLVRVADEKGYVFNVSTSAKLEESKKNGNVYKIEKNVNTDKINAFVNNNTNEIVINLDSGESLNSLAGHEITHTLEIDKYYEPLQKAVIAYAKTKGEYDGRMESIKKRYSGDDAFLTKEFTAEALGDYLFTDSEFINNLSTNHRNIFQKIYDEIKYLCKVATAGSKELRELEKVKKAFEKVYRESATNKHVSSKDAGINYSVSDNNIKISVNDFVSDEMFATMTYVKDGKVVGKLDYSEYKGEPNVKMIEVIPEYRRNGIAKKMLQELQRQYPDTEINYGMTTPDGTKLLDSITYTQIDEQVTEGKNKLETLKTEIEYVERRLNELYDIENPTNEQQKEIEQLGEKWDKLYYIDIPKLTDEYLDKPSSKRFVKLDDVNYSLSDSDGNQLTKEQQEYFKDSKARDKDGNLKRVYHSSNAAGFTVFEGSVMYFTDSKPMADSYAGSTEKVDTARLNSVEESQEWLDNIGVADLEIRESNGKYELYDRDIEEMIVEYDSEETLYRNLKRDFQEYYGDTEAGGRYEGYLNIKNPLVIDAEGRNWDKVSSEFSQKLYDSFKSLTDGEKQALQSLAEWDDYSVFKDELVQASYRVKSGNADEYSANLASAYDKAYFDASNLFDLTMEGFTEEALRSVSVKYLSTDKIVERAMEDGSYDGVIIENVRDYGGHAISSPFSPTGTDYVIFNSNQFKAADNTVPTSDADIRYSLSEDSESRQLSEGQRDFFKDAKTLDKQGRLKPYYHGTGRADRVGNVFRSDRATSGPMAFFTDSKAIADNYAKDKKDTSIAYDEMYDSYYTQFRIEINGENLSISDAWNKLPTAKRAEIKRKAQHVTMDDDYENVIYDEQQERGLGGFDKYRINEHKGNYLSALVGEWLEDGNLYGNEEKFIDVLSLVGLNDVQYMNPYARDEKTYQVYLNVTNPFNTTDISEEMVQAFKDAADKADYAPGNLADMWDKRNIEPSKWIEQLERDIENGTTHVWTSIPDFVTDTLKAHGYDGIFDEGGKGGGAVHQVVIPFYSEQIKNVENINPTSNPDIRYDISGSGRRKVYGDYNVYGKDIRFKEDIAPVQETTDPISKDGKFVEVEPLTELDVYLRDAQTENEHYFPDDMPMVEEEETYDGEFANHVKPDDPFYEKDIWEVGRDRKQKAYMYENPEVKPFFQQEARYMLGELDNSQKGEKFYNDQLYYDTNGEMGFFGTQRFTSDEIAYLLDSFNYTYKDIAKGLRAIIEDNGKENNAISKRIEFLLDERLRLGYKDFWTGDRIPPNQDYINLLNEKQITEYDDESWNNWLRNLTEDDINQYFSMAEDTPDEVAPTRSYVPVEVPVEEAAEPAPLKEDKPKKEPQIAKIIYDEQKPTKEKSGFFDSAMELIADKGFVFENLAKKTKNRELEAKWNFTRYSEGRGQDFIGKGTDNVRAITDLKAEVEKAGLTEALNDYVYHLHNIDRMSLVKNARAKEKTLIKENPILNELSRGDTVEKIARKLAESSEQITIDDIFNKEYLDKKLKMFYDNKARQEAAADLFEKLKELIHLREVRNKPVYGSSVTAKVSMEEVSKLAKQYPELKEYAQEIYKINDYLKGMLVDGGVISKESADLWSDMYPHYVPIKRKAHNGASINVPLDTRKTGINAPVKKATGGNSDFYPVFETMADRALQTYKAVAKNRFGVELKNTLGTVVDSTSASVDNVIDGVDTHEDLLQEGKHGNNPTFTVFENGERVTFEISDDMYDALKPTNKTLAYTNPVANIASNIHRGVLTEYNPAFLASNAIKDVQEVLINSQHPLKTYATLPKAYKELVSKGKWYAEYMENGGESNTYFDRKSVKFKKEKSMFVKALGIAPNAISYANNFIERAPRLAEYIASREAGRSIETSMLDAARVTTNFAAGGDLTKFLNRNGATFLNASVQGAMQQVRNVREAKMNGLKGWTQLAAKYTLAGLPAILLNGLLWDDDEEYKELSDYVKENYYVVAKYGDGKFVRIPKGRTIAVIQNAIDQTKDALTGDEEFDLRTFTKEAITNLANLAPNNPIENNILAPIFDVANNETWYGEKLVPTRLEDLPAREQFDESTDFVSKQLGEWLDVSPYKINYLLDQYSGGIGDVFLPMATPEAESGDNSFKGNLLAPIKDKFTTDGVMNNQNVSAFYDKSDELTTNAKASTATDEDILANKYFNSVSTEIGKLYAEKREIQSSDMSDSEKYYLVRELQKQINSLAKEALAEYENVNIDGIYSTVGDRQYTLKDGSWKKLDNDQIEKQDKVTSKLGITQEEYWSNKAEYDFAYEEPGKYAIAKTIGGYDAYEAHKEVINDFDSYDVNGEKKNGLKKEKVENYIFNLDIDYGQQILLFRSMYKSQKDKDKYNAEIVNYLNDRYDISYDEVITILEELEMTVNADGSVSW